MHVDDMRWATSSDGVRVALHDLGGPDAVDPGRDGTAPTLLFSHATGFHGHCYAPMAAALTDRVHCVALDHRGHGYTDLPTDPATGSAPAVDWRSYGDDALAAARAVAPQGGLIGFGHSMGGASLLMAAHRAPGQFALIVAFEPIVFPPAPPGEERPESPLVAGARRRRRTFPSVEAAIENYATKPPLGSFTPEALRAYVEHGTRPAPGGGVELRCDPEHEARTFEQGGRNHAWDLLGEITVPVVVVAGAVTEASPAAIAADIAAELPHGRYLELAHLDHFGPMTHPAEMAAVVAAAIDETLDDTGVDASRSR